MTSKYVRKKKIVHCLYVAHTSSQCHWYFWKIFTDFSAFLYSHIVGLLRLCIHFFFLCIIVYICYNIWKFISQDTILFASSSSSFFSVFYFCFFLFISIPTSIFFNNILFSQHKTLTFWFCSQARSQSNNTQGKLYILYIK